MDMSNVSEILKSKKIQPSSLRFGFLGLGIMASGIVKNLINFEHRVNLWCETPSKVSTFFVLEFIVLHRFFFVLNYDEVLGSVRESNDEMNYNTILDIWGILVGCFRKYAINYSLELNERFPILYIFLLINSSTCLTLTPK